MKTRMEDVLEPREGRVLMRNDPWGNSKMGPEDGSLWTLTAADLVDWPG